MPLTVWIAGGAALLSGAAFFWCLFLSWALGKGTEWEPKLAWAAHWSAIALAASLNLLLLAGWWELKP